MANEEFVATVLGVIVLVLIIILLVFMITLLDVHGYTKKLWKLFLSAKPKTGIDKEIADEEKDIAELEKHKEKMDTLAELKRRKERLFEEVHENGVTEEYTHCKWCCGENTLKTALTRDGISYHICTSCGNEQ